MLDGVADDYPLIHELFAAASRRGVSIERLRTLGPLLTDDSFERALLQHASSRPYHNTSPFLGLIQIEAELCSVADYDAAAGTLAPVLLKLNELLGTYTLHVAFRMRVSWMSADGLFRLGRVLEEVKSHGLTIDFATFDGSAQSPEALTVELNRFLDDPLATKLRLAVAGLPFCLVARRHFRAVLAGQSRPLLGDISGQLQGVAANRSSVPATLPRCTSCPRRVACYAEARVYERKALEPWLEPSPETTVVFAGASLSEEDRAPFLAPDVVFVRPAEQGDFFAAIIDGFDNILLIDGYFAERVSVSTLEVMLALYAGINVFGAASMGALRGRELDRFGMRVIGYSYDYLKSQHIVPYHVVAQLYSDDDLAVTDPLINVRYFLDCATDEAVILRVEADEVFAVADAIHYTRLSFELLFRSLEQKQILSAASRERLRRFFAEHGRGAFDAKNRDAKKLLGCYRTWLERDPDDFVLRTLETAVNRNVAVLGRLFGKASVLPKGWDRQLIPRRRTRRERSLDETLAVVQDLTADLDLTIADTTKFLDMDYHMISVVFPPFMHFLYLLSASSGFGPSRKQALCVGFMEFFERLSMLDLGFGDRLAKLPPFDLDKAPEHALASKPDGRWVPCTNIVSGKVGRVPSSVGFAQSSIGLSAGNTLLEAVVYGIFECIERDVVTMYQTNLLRNGGDHLVLDPMAHGGDDFREIVAKTMAFGVDVKFWWRPNLYGVAMVETALRFEGELYAGYGCRLALDEAVERSFFEALAALFVTYAGGSRDDATLIRTPPVFLDYWMARPKRFWSAPRGPRRQRSLTQLLGELVKRLRRAGRKEIWVVNFSPKSSALATVKVIIPGLDLGEFSSGVRTAGFAKKVRRTYDLIPTEREMRA